MKQRGYINHAALSHPISSGKNIFYKAFKAMGRPFQLVRCSFGIERALNDVIDLQLESIAADRCRVFSPDFSR